MIDIQETESGLLFLVRVQPKARGNKILGDFAGMLKVGVTAPAEKGKANAAVIALLSKKLDVPKSSIKIVCGETSRIKTLRVKGVSLEDILALV